MRSDVLNHESNVVFLVIVTAVTAPSMKAGFWIRDQINLHQRLSHSGTSALYKAQ